MTDPNEATPFDGYVTAHGTVIDYDAEKDRVTATDTNGSLRFIEADETLAQTVADVAYLLGL